MMGANLDNDLPAGWVTVTSAKHARLFLDSDAITLTLSNTNAISYELRDYDGDVVRTGTPSGTSLTFVGLPFGWYALYLYQAGTSGLYGHLIGKSQFSILNTDVRMKSPPAAGTPFGGELAFQGQDHIVNGVSLGCSYRNQIAAAEAPTTTGSSIARTQEDRVYQREWYEDLPDAARPRPAFLQFPNGGYQTTAHRTGVATTVAALYPDIEYFEGPSNEPDMNNPDVATWMQTFKTAVKAGNASAKVMGPNPVEFHPGAIAKLKRFITDGGLVGLDALSLHPYHDSDGDIPLGRRVYDGLMRTLKDTGYEGIEIWLTEWGQHAATYGVMHVRRQCRWWAVGRMLRDQYGIPKERDYWFYPTSHGFWDYPSFWKLEDGTVTPIIAMMRAFSQEVWGKVWTERLDFGTVDNDWYIGSRYESPDDGTSVLALLSDSRTDGSVTFRVDGTSSLTRADCFGNTTTITVTGGLATVPVTMEPSYVRLPDGVIASPVATVYGTNLARGRAAFPEAARSITNGRLENPNSGVAGDMEYRSIGVGLPAEAGVTFDLPQWVDTIIVRSATPWSLASTLLDFDVQVRMSDSDSWRTVQTITEPHKTIAARGSAPQGGAKLETYHSGRAGFEIRLETPVLAGQVRLYVRSTTYGGAPTAAAAAEGDIASAEAYITLREIRVFCRAPIPRRRTFAAL